MCARVAYTTQRRRANAHTAERNKNVYKIERREPWNGLRILLKFSISLCVQFATKRNHRIGVWTLFSLLEIPKKGFSPFESVAVLWVQLVWFFFVFLFEISLLPTSGCPIRHQQHLCWLCIKRNAHGPAFLTFHVYFGAPINVGPPTFFVFVLSVSAVVPITSSSSIWYCVEKGGKGHSRPSPT